MKNNHTTLFKLLIMLFFITSFTAIIWFTACFESNSESNNDELSDNSYLTSIVIVSYPELKSIPLIFEKETFSYSLISCGIADVQIQSASEDENASIRINGIDVESGVFTDIIRITSGIANVITIQVIAQNGSIKDYILTINAEAVSCDNSCQDGNETDVNCGGICSKCADGKRCLNHSDCESQVCSYGICRKTCADMVRNGTESDIDCGGTDSPSCQRCPTGKRCIVNSDCAWNSCINNICM